MRIRIASFAAVALAASFVQAQDVKVETYRLPNGLRVILAPDHSLPMATINTWFNVGAKMKQIGALASPTYLST